MKFGTIFPPLRGKRNQSKLQRNLSEWYSRNKKTAIRFPEMPGNSHLYDIRYAIRHFYDIHYDIR